MECSLCHDTGIYRVPELATSPAFFEDTRFCICPAGWSRILNFEMVAQTVFDYDRARFSNVCTASALMSFAVALLEGRT